LKFTDAEQKLAKFFVEREGEGILEEIREIDFIEAGIIDSLDLVSLAVYIEKNFNKRLIFPVQGLLMQQGVLTR